MYMTTCLKPIHSYLPFGFSKWFLSYHFACMFGYVRNQPHYLPYNLSEI